MPLAIDALVYDAVAYDGILVCWHRLLKLKKQLEKLLDVRLN
jgi:hypothetical protein